MVYLMCNWMWLLCFDTLFLNTLRSNCFCFCWGLEGSKWPTTHFGCVQFTFKFRDPFISFQYHPLLVLNLLLQYSDISLHTNLSRKGANYSFLRLCGWVGMTGIAMAKYPFSMRVLMKAYHLQEKGRWNNTYLYSHTMNAALLYCTMSQWSCHYLVRSVSFVASILKYHDALWTPVHKNFQHTYTILMVALELPAPKV